METHFLKNDCIFNNFQEDACCSGEIKAECHEEGQSDFERDSMGRENKVSELKS